MVDRRTMRWYWDHYLPAPGRSPPSGRVPLRADDLRGVAPVIVVTAEQDVLREEGEAYVTALVDVGFRRIRCLCGRCVG
ncbi:alpha/beta hydrolase fold domain-containing protein [Amycolatopsis pigmentata]|uniref:Alpha/beta hydrolase fold domain-containing protein n=1 Tax=Amycolatopsis pigmentata TaxID=450801 RepID=A0ABW5FIW4_9PSEU